MRNDDRTMDRAELEDDRHHDEAWEDEEYGYDEPGGYEARNRSPADIEDDIERTRSELDRTIDALAQRLSLSELINEAFEWMGSAREIADNFGRGVRNNPIPLALVGAGLGWLMLDGEGRRRPRSSRDGMTEEVRERAEHYGAEAAGKAAGWAESARGEYESAKARESAEHAGEMGGAARERMGEWSEAARSTYEEAKRRGAGAAEGMREGAEQVGERAYETGRAARDRMASAGESAMHRARRGYEAADEMAHRGAKAVSDTFGRMLSEQPLVLAGLGLAVGAALGAALPRTRAEDKWMGPARDELLDRAKATGEEWLTILKDASAEVKDAAAAEAERQGLTIEEVEHQARELVRSGKSVAEAGIDAAYEEAERRGLTREQATEEVRRTVEKLEAVARAARDAAKREASRHNGGEQVKAAEEAAEHRAETVAEEEPIEPPPTGRPIGRRPVRPSAPRPA
jgi:hypothetical protein